jgi:hypothetical protein
VSDCISIRYDRPAPCDEWLGVCLCCPYATYFHTPEWAMLFSAYTKGAFQPFPRIITFSDNRRALVPLSYKRHAKGFLKTFLSSPAGTFGGWIARQPLTIGHTKALSNYLQSFSNIVWRENPYDPVLKDIDIKHSTNDFTQTINLQCDYDTIFTAASRAHHKAVRKAIREGVTIVEAKSMEDWQHHFTSYQASLKRWEQAGTIKKRLMPYKWELFRLIAEKPTAHRTLWLAKHNGIIASSVVCFYWNKHAVAWHGSAFEEYFDVRPNNLLYQHMIQDAHKRGYHWFDCNTPGDLQGVIEFKDHLGTERKTSRVLDKSGLVKTIYRGLFDLFHT